MIKNNYYSLLVNDPNVFLEQLERDYMTMKNSDFYKCINSYDETGKLYKGGNLLHALFNILVVTKNMDKVIIIFNRLVTFGINLYHYDIYGENPYEFIKHYSGLYKQLFDSVKQTYNHFKCNDLTCITMCNGTLQHYTNIIIDNLNSVQDIDKMSILGSVNMERYNRLDNDTYDIIILDLVRHYLYYKSVYNHFMLGDETVRLINGII